MIALLGPFEAPADVGAGKPRALLARLALDGGRVVPAQALVEALWGETPPPSASKVLQAHVSALRKALGRETIETRGGGYVLHAETDLHRFEELAAKSRVQRDPAARARLLREALSLWRGEPLAEMREPFAAAAALRLNELRLEALTLRIDAQLELGDDAALVAELRDLVDREPLRERPRAQLMRALYRAGRQAEALSVYRDGRIRFVSELGLEPGPELQQLERAILRQDPALGGASALSRGVVVCVGAPPLRLLAPLDRELVAIELVPDADTLAAAGRRPAVPGVRSAAFTSEDPVADIIRVAADQSAELLVVREATDELLAGAPCDVALWNAVQGLDDGPVAVPFGGRRDEWPALEVGAWLARAHGRVLQLFGVEASAGRRDASRALAGASLALQRFAGVAAETVLVPPGPAAIHGAVVVASLPAAALDKTRRNLLAKPLPVLLVHGGLRPGGLAPAETRTRFSWSLSGQ